MVLVIRNVPYFFYLPRNHFWGSSLTRLRKIAQKLRHLTYWPAICWRKLTRSPLDGPSRFVGAAALPHARREGLGKLLDTQDRALEIGPGIAPLICGPNAEYFDVEDRGAKLRNSQTNIPSITHLSPTADLTIVPTGVALVCSSHVIEHTPDLIDHLQQVSRLLNAGGRYVLVVPDKRYCFDAGLQPTHLGEVIQAHLEQRTTHQFASIFESAVLRTHNRAGRHWRGRSFERGYLDDRISRTQEALGRYHAADGAYLNAHAWQFTPSVFDTLLRDLKELDFLDLDIEFVCETPKGRNEFTACLVKS